MAGARRGFRIHRAEPACPLLRYEEHDCALGIAGKTTAEMHWLGVGIEHSDSSGLNPGRFRFDRPWEKLSDQPRRALAHDVGREKETTSGIRRSLSRMTFLFLFAS